MELLQDRVPLAAPQLDGQQGARHSLRQQIDRLEREVSLAIGRPESRAMPSGVPALSGPRLLDLGELERLRDNLAAQLEQTRREQVECAAHYRANRELLERAFCDPAGHPGLRLTNLDLGIDGCGIWSVRPRLGLLGRLMGWWRVKVSSGCP